jgi:hypothetical protein
MNIQNFKSLWSNQKFKKAYDNIHKAILSKHTVKLLFPGCNLEYNEKSRHVGFLGLNQSLSLGNYKKLQSLLQEKDCQCTHLQWIKDGEFEQDEKIDFTSGNSNNHFKLYKHYEWDGGLETLNTKQTEQLEAEQRTFIGEDNQQSPITYFKTLHQIVQWATVLHPSLQTPNIGHFDMFPIRVTKSDYLEQQFDKEPTFWEECIRSTTNEIEQMMHHNGVLIVSNALLIRTCFSFDGLDPQISNSVTRRNDDNMWPKITLQWCSKDHALRLCLDNTIGPYVIVMRNPGSGFANSTKFQVANELGRLLAIKDIKKST